MKSKRILLTAIFIFSCIIFSCSPKGTSQYTVKATGGLNMRASASLKGNRVGLLPNGAVVTVIKKKGSEVTIGGRKGHWAYISWQQKKGWVFDAFLVKKQTKSKLDAKKLKSATLTATDSGAPYMEHDQVAYTIKLNNGKVHFTSVNTVPVGSTTIKHNGTYKISGNKIQISLHTGTSKAVSIAEKKYVRKGTTPAKKITLHWVGSINGFIPEKRLKYVNNSDYVAIAKDGYFISKKDLKTKEQGQFKQIGFYQIKK